ncbi:KpsF/GutQ family sugar-phosphate isomerase [Kordiimonas laminariae]|uniref:KpsF/GutQ family sugar-phosphate isomerase n=1 Tax=Kordiimonas laminariae TaxID=2917717 RepID=UPI001FF5E40A|nr:KpsF/GutQ family sugar-phosphate isomerase [Kordiimonas laminariae]MCK0067994.1 KpsF/GutQ family sugar-phosphate isomerase [Kordiimonas laminariae]
MKSSADLDANQENILELPVSLKADIGQTLKDIGSNFLKQGQALERLSQTYDEDAFRDAIMTIMNTRGHLIVIGMGKSGHVARKISATLASTGTPSFFLHPAEASHGDLGMVTADDALLLISYSGETPEISQLLPSLKSFGNKIIAITGAKNSTMGRVADVVLEIPITEEACPINLAPTTSIIVTAAIGDALAVSLMKLRNFHARDFARYHPGGSLGRRLLTKVEEAMLVNNVPKVSPDMVLLELAAEMAGGSAGVAVVLDKAGAPIGVVTKGQLGVALRVTRRVREVAAHQCMSKEFSTIQKDVIVDEAESMMRSDEVKFLVVVDEKGRYAGIYKHEDA